MHPITLTIADACKASGISRATLYRAIGRNELDIVKIGARSLIKCEQLKSWLEGNTLKKRAA